MKPDYLAIEAVICAAPSFLVGSVGALIFLWTGASMLGYRPIEGVQGIAAALGLVISLWQYASLALRTLAGERYVFGVLFWVGSCVGAFGVWVAIDFFGLVLGSAISLPIVVASVHFIWLQISRRRER